MASTLSSVARCSNQRVVSNVNRLTPPPALSQGKVPKRTKNALEFRFSDRSNFSDRPRRNHRLVDVLAGPHRLLCDTVLALMSRSLPLNLFLCSLPASVVEIDNRGLAGSTDPPWQTERTWLWQESSFPAAELRCLCWHCWRYLRSRTRKAR